jgi:hypothetical protein
MASAFEREANYVASEMLEEKYDKLFEDIREAISQKVPFPQSENQE